MSDSVSQMRSVADAGRRPVTPAPRGNVGKVSSAAPQWRRPNQAVVLRRANPERVDHAASTVQDPISIIIQPGAEL